MSECYDLHKLYELGLEGKRRRPVKRRKGFKLLCLPGLARNEVIRSMDINEIIKLSLSSSKMEGVIRYARVKVNQIAILVTTCCFMIIQIKSFNKNYYHCSPDNLKKGSKNLGPKIMSPWIDKNSTSFQNSVSIFKHLQNIFWFESHCICVKLKDTPEQLFKEVLTEPTFKDFLSLSLDGGDIDTEYLDLVMETVNINSDLHIYDTWIPENYYHENAFKFDYTTYYFAEWVRIEYLFTLKDRYSLRLRYHNLTDFDLNTYIKFWIENDHDMVYLLALHMRPFEHEILFDGIVVLLGQRNNFIFYLVACNPTKQRKKQIMGVLWFNGITHLYSWDKDETLELEEDVYTGSWAPEYKLLMILNKKKDLEEELKKIQNVLENNQDQNMIEKKNHISRELQNVSIELDSYNLVFRDGFYCLM